MAHQPIVYDSEGVTRCTFCDEPVRLDGISFEDDAVEGVRRIKVWSPTCRRTREEKRKLPCSSYEVCEIT